MVVVNALSINGSMEVNPPESVPRSNLTILLRGAGVNLGARSIAVSLGFVASILIARNYGSDTLGILATVTSVFSLVATVGLLGLNAFALKETSTILDLYGWCSVRAFYFRILWVVLTGCLLVGGIVYLSGFVEKFNLGGVHKLLPFFLIVVSACLTLNSAFLRGTGDYIIFSLLDFLPAFLMVSIAVVAVIGNIQKDQFVNLYFFGNIIACAASFYFVFKKIRNSNSGKRPISGLPTYGNTLKTSLPMLGVTLSAMFIQHADILLIGHFLQPNDVGVYSVYMKISSLVSFATISISAMFSPTVAALYKKSDFPELKKYAKRTTLVTSVFALFFGILLLLTHEQILGFYTYDFLVEKKTLFILILVPIIHSFFGASGHFLNMTGSQNRFLVIIIFGAMLNLIGNLVLIPKYGIQGAAVASLVSVFAWNVAAMILIKMKHGYTLFYLGKSALQE